MGNELWASEPYGQRVICKMNFMKRIFFIELLHCYSLVLIEQTHLQCYSASEQQKWSTTKNLPMWPSTSSKQWGSGRWPRGWQLYMLHTSAGIKAACPTQNLSNNTSDHTKPACKELSLREKQHKEHLNADPASSKRITGVLFSKRHPEREKIAVNTVHPHAALETRTSRPTADCNYTKFTVKSDGFRPTYYTWQNKYAH